MRPTENRDVFVPNFGTVIELIMQPIATPKSRHEATQDDSAVVTEIGDVGLINFGNADIVQPLIVVRIVEIKNTGN